MKIEIAEPGRMTQSGSSLLRLIQNNNMPVLDLLVRESIQNSLDAKKQGARFVDVQFLTGKFDRDTLNHEFEVMEDSLNKRFTDLQYEYLAIRDSNTVGLTGETNFREVKNNEFGNLLKLVYEICKPQQDEGAGGSWGIGKTVYFRIGIGLVIYYSRIKLENGEYASRLAASYVEDETKPDALLPSYKGMTKRGIAWWGESVSENETQPVTDEEYIRVFLDIFGIPEYEGDETGTTIIIPYTDSETLLSNNLADNSDDGSSFKRPYWCVSVEEYLRISVQRWYAARLNNPKYDRGAFLKATIDGKPLAYDDMKPVFKLIHDLYNRANYVSADDFISEKKIEVGVESIEVIKYLTEKGTGNIAYAKVNREVLGMGAGSNEPEPYVFANCTVRQGETNRPIICYTRQPAMIVSYETDGVWASGIRSSSKEEYIIGIFVLASDNKLKGAPTEKSLEEYVRKSEMADHTSWKDWTEGTYNPRIISKIQSKVVKKIDSECGEDDVPDTEKKASSLGKMFGDLLLPPEGFGKKGSAGQGSGTGSGPSAVRKGYSFKVHASEIRYKEDMMVVPVVFATSGKNKIRENGFDIKIGMESDGIDLSTWEEDLGFESPFSVESFQVNISGYDSDKLIMRESFESTEKATVRDYAFSPKVTRKGSCYGVHFESPTEHSLKMTITLFIRVKRRDFKPVFVFERKGK